jgi:hypothetical protein
VQQLPPRREPERFEISAFDMDARMKAMATATDHYDRIRREGDDYLRDLSIADHVRRDVLKYLDVAHDYLNGRGIAPLKEHVVPIGVVPALKTGLRERLLLDGGEDFIYAADRAGLFRSYRDRRDAEAFAGRVTLPWRDDAGRIAALKGRGIPALAVQCDLGVRHDGTITVPMLFQRVNDTDPDRLPHVQRPRYPFGWYAAARMDTEATVLIVEAEIDALSVMIAGVPALATGGAFGMGRKQLPGLVNADRTIVVYDDDDAGWKGGASLARKIGCAMSVLPRKMDANDVLRDEGVAALANAIDDAIKRAGPPPEPELVEPVPGSTSSSPDETGLLPPRWLNDGPPPDDTDPEARRKPSKTKHSPPSAASTNGCPPGWGLNDDTGELFRVHITSSGEQWESTGLRNPPEIVWRGRDVDDHTIVMGLEARIVGSVKTVELGVARSAIKTTRDIVSTLADHGVDVDSTTAATLVRYLTDLEHHVGPSIPFRSGARQLGWHGKSFLYGEDCYGDDQISYIGEEAKVMRSVGQKGTHEEWVEGVLRRLERYPHALFGLYAALCGPVLHHLPGVTGFAVEYAGLSSSGKSTTASAIASAFGDPTLDGGLLRMPRDTINALELYAALMRNLPLFLEDAHLIDPPDRARDLIMSWVNGTGKGRAKRTGSARQEPRAWSTVAILTGESSIADSTTYGGVGSRVLTFEPPLPRVRGDEGVNEDVVEDIRTMDGVGAQNYGHAGRLWVQFLVDGGVHRVLQAYDDLLPMMRRVAGHEGPQQRWAKDLALVLAVADVAPDVIGGRPFDDAIEIAIAQLQSRVVPDQAHEAMELLLSWMAMDASGGLTGTDVPAHESRRFVWFRVLDDGTVCASLAEVRRRLRNDGISLNVVQREWVRRGWLEHQGQPCQRVKIRLGSGTTSCIPISPNRAKGFKQPQPLYKPPSRYQN